MVANRIVKLRKKAGMNQAQLAKKLNVTPSTVGMYEQGRRYPNIEMLIKLSKIFDVSLDFLITGSEYPHSKEYSPKKRIPENCPCKSCFWKDYRDT